MVLGPAHRTAVAAACIVATVTLARLATGDNHPATFRAQADHRPLTYFIADGDRDSGYRPSDRELAAWAFETWARNAAGTIRLEVTPEQDAVVRLYWASGNGSTYGEMHPLLVGGRPGAAVFVRPDIEALGVEMASRAREDPLWRDTIVYLTCLHELGHALGLAHTADERDIMYSFSYGGDIVEYFARYRRQITTRGDIRSVSGLSEADVQRLRAIRGAS